MVDNQLGVVVGVADGRMQQRVDLGALVLTETLVEIQLQEKKKGKGARRRRRRRRGMFVGTCMQSARATAYI